MARVKSIKYIGKQPVYNMTVDKVHNFLIGGDIIAKNCDMLRYFCVYWTLPADYKKEDVKRTWTWDMYEDYENANEEEKQLLIRKWGVPR